MGNSIKKGVKNASSLDHIPVKVTNIQEIGTSKTSITTFNSKQLDCSFRDSQLSSSRLWGRVPRRNNSRCNTNDPLNSSKTFWPISHVESIFLPQFKIAENNQEKYTILNKLAKGAFGKVYLVVDKTTSEKYALKTISKAQVISEGTVLQLKDEVDIQSICGHHPFIVQCVSFWQTKKNIFLLSQYIPSGELFAKIKVFSFNLVQLYVAEIAFALDFLHNAGVIYRDIKPENILLDADYHIKLTDFGLSKWLKIGNRTRTICGTLQYMAPEILNGEPYDHSVDWYALGVLAHRMLTDKYPNIQHPVISHVDTDLNIKSHSFHSVPTKESDKNHGNSKENNISNDKLFLKKSGLSLEDINGLDSRSKDLLIRLLETNPKFRLKSLLGLKRIAMFQFFKFEDIKHKKIVPKDLIEDFTKIEQINVEDNFNLSGSKNNNEWNEFDN